LCPEADGFRVAWRLDDAKFGAGDPVAELPRSMVGAPTVALDGEAVAAVDDAGHLPLSVSDAESDDGEPVRRWSVLRSTVGPIEVSYPARPDHEEPRPATPPLELRREGGGLSGALKWFLVLPVIPESSTFQLRWEQPSGPATERTGRRSAAWVRVLGTTVSSLGTGSRSSGIPI